MNASPAAERPTKLGHHFSLALGPHPQRELTLMPRRCIQRFVALSAIAALCALGPLVPAAAAQRRQARPPGEMARGVSPMELQRMFDAYIVVQAQEVLQLTDEQYPRFVSRLKALQEARRKGQAERRRLLQELRRLSQAPGGEEQIKDRLRMLDDASERSAGEVRQALSAVDEVLNLRQQARFRAFEEEMERRQVELLMRARQANRRPGH